MQRKIVETADGSRTIYIEDWDENYHSTNGALQEAKHVFIDKVKEQLGDRKEISILEMGFGTGLNGFLMLQLALELNLEVNYIGIEAYPVKPEEMEALNYSAIWPEGKSYLESMHKDTWGQKSEIHSLFHLTKFQTNFENWKGERNTYDFVFFDAFAPRVQPHLWTESIFKSIFDATKNGGVFLTYCAKGQVRRDLEKVGWTMSRLPGPPGKREMLFGKK